jgi:DNA-binding response OmpR family regulator
MKILIIEDEIELLIAIGNYLTKENYICELAESFTKASEKTAVYEYDIILWILPCPMATGSNCLKQ